MPLVYADTSALFAFFHPRDEFSQVVILDEFWTCDTEQGILASAAGLKVRRFELKDSPVQPAQ
jgi:hypothetical protein